MRDKIALKIVAILFVLVVAVVFVTLMLGSMFAGVIAGEDTSSINISNKECLDGLPQDYNFWRPTVNDQQNLFRGYQEFRPPPMQRDKRTHIPRGMPEYDKMFEMPRSFEDMRELNENRTMKLQMQGRVEELRKGAYFNNSQVLERVRASDESPYFSISGNYSEIWQESIDANWTEAYIVSDLDGDNNPDVLVFTEKYEPTADIYTEKVIAKSGYDGTHLWEESVSGNSCSINIVGFGCWWDYWYYWYYPYYPYPNQIDFDGDGLEDGIVEIYKYDSTTNTTTGKVIAKKGSDGTTLWEESVSASEGDGCDIWAFPAGDLDGDGLDDVMVQWETYDSATHTETEGVIAKRGYDGTHLWEESVSGYNCGIEIIGFASWWGWYYGYPYQHKIDFDGDGLEDGIVRIYKYDSVTNTTTDKVIAKKGSDGTTLWEESVSTSGKYNCYIYAVPAEDLNGDGRDDVMVWWTAYDSATHTETEGVIAKRGYDGTHLWEESVSGDSCSIDIIGFGCWWGGYYGYPYPNQIDFDGDGLEDGIVEIYKYDSVTNMSIGKVIAKKGSDGTNFWEESVSASEGDGCDIWTFPAGNLDGDTKSDAYVHSYAYDSGTEQAICNLKAKRGYDGTNLWEAQSNDYIWVALPFYSWYYYPYYEGYENASLSYDLNCDGKNDSLIWISTEMHAITAGYPLNVSIITPPDSFSTVAGSELIVKATVLDEDTLLHNATVDGKLSSNSFELYDDGRSSHGDDAKDDGIYSAKLTVPKIQNAILEITARYEGKFGSASRTVNIDTSTTQPLKVEAEIIDDNPPPFTGDTVKVRAVVSLNGSIVSTAEVKSTIIYPNSYQKNITLQNKGDYYEADFDWLFQGGEFTFDVVAYPQEDAIQGYDTEKLKVYHGYLYLTQEDTGALFKKGEPVDFKVEVTCAGLTCPDEVTSAEVIMEILPDNEEIALVGNGDGTYHATYTFTTAGIRDISFSASVPFCIPAEVNGNSIEIKEEDYELKKAVENFADDNIETLNATRSYASDLALAGDYFFNKLHEDASVAITNLVFAPLADVATSMIGGTIYGRA